MTTSKKRVLAIIISIILVILIGGALYLQSEYNSIGVNNQVVPTPTSNPAIEVISKPSQETVKVGRTETITINLPSTSAEKPTAFDLTFSYNRDYVQVINIVPGKIWNSSNVLKKVIDNNEGTVRIAAGQGFNAQTTNSLDLVEIEYKVIQSGNIVFQLTKDSKFAFLGDTQITPVTTSQVVIKAED